MPTTRSDPIAAVRRFNRFYTRQIGLLDEGLLDSPFSLTAVRVLYEIAYRPGITATELQEILALDAGYLSRLLRGLRKQGLVTARAPASDRRQRQLSLTARGRQTFGALDARSSEEVGAMLARLSRSERRDLIASLGAIEGLLEKAGTPDTGSGTVVLREPRLAAPRPPGGLGARQHVRDQGAVRGGHR